MRWRPDPVHAAEEGERLNLQPVHYSRQIACVRFNREFVWLPIRKAEPPRIESHQTVSRGQARVPVSHRAPCFQLKVCAGKR